MKQCFPAARSNNSLYIFDTQRVEFSIIFKKKLNHYIFIRTWRSPLNNQKQIPSELFHFNTKENMEINFAVNLCKLISDRSFKKVFKQIFLRFIRLTTLWLKQNFFCPRKLLPSVVRVYLKKSRLSVIYEPICSVF